jgi:hypothetical protein
MVKIECGGTHVERTNGQAEDRSAKRPEYVLHFVINHQLALWRPRFQTALDDKLSADFPIFPSACCSEWNRTHSFISFSISLRQCDPRRGGPRHLDHFVLELLLLRMNAATLSWIALSEASWA